MKSETFN